MVIRSRKSLKREALHSLIIDIMTRLNVSPTDWHFIQILGHILLAVYAESICNITAVLPCLEIPFLHSYLLCCVLNTFIIFVIVPLR